jgi:hypothetical protein
MLTLAFITTLSIVNGQGNLQFNRAIYKNFQSVSSSDYWVIDTLIVPSGKVCKITSVGLYGYRAGVLYNTLFMNNVPIAYVANRSDYTYTTKIADFPIWLNSGTYIFKFKSYSSITSYAYYSGVEFNIIQ